jgi:hypothetical protein
VPAVAFEHARGAVVVAVGRRSYTY